MGDDPVPRASVDVRTACLLLALSGWKLLRRFKSEVQQGSIDGMAE
jgi:hypothetical protein